MTASVLAEVAALDLAAQDLPLLADMYRLGEVEEVRYLPDGLMNRNWQLRTAGGEFALKLLLDAPVSTVRRNLSVAAALAAAGVPACPPVLTLGGDVVAEMDDRAYSLFGWLEGEHIAGTGLSAGQAHHLGGVVGRLHRELNDPGLRRWLPAAGAVTATVAAPGEAVAEADRYLRAIGAFASAAPFDVQTVELLRRRKALIAEYGHLRPATDQPAGPAGYTHGDLQHRNIIWRDGVVAGVIDWDRIRVRPFGEEIARTATLQFGGEAGELDLELVAAFVAGYRAVVAISDAELADAVDRLWWKRASDFWQLVFHYDRGDHSCDHLFFSGETFLHWWTANRVQVRDAFAARP
ncbi:phosphotransferase [Solwaraspora sp. WMMA2065]|uniref:phosphotransferase n=1 Tax=Solwaraspora sp. WMMA2065 TaxID=3015166 RepID=UPI00259BD6BD|nr:phosphotransferase [Solwaraspora sp. WMMA2065]WJK33774.1 phosphotransferase [Solwaraspora sp. WMMA2065]